MERLLLLLARVAGVAGVLICAGAGVARLTGHYWLGGFQIGTLLLAGIAAMTLACLCYLAALAERLKTSRF